MTDILKIKMGENDANADTIGDYLRLLLKKVWVESEYFSGKRPFGNSGWEYEVYEALAKAGVVKADFDENGYIEEMDTDLARKIIIKSIGELK